MWEDSDKVVDDGWVTCPDCLGADDQCKKCGGKGQVNWKGKS